MLVENFELKRVEGATKNHQYAPLTKSIINMHL